MTSTTPTLWNPPAGVRVRGVIALIAGAGESARVYERFGRRISADGYTVAVFETGAGAAAEAWLSQHPDGPRVLAGSDRGAAEVLALAAQIRSAEPDSVDAAGPVRIHGSAPNPVDGVIVAGLPLGDVDDATAALGERTACPVHLGVLADDAARTPAAPSIEIPDAAVLGTVDVPVLALHGGADTLSPFALVREKIAALPRAELVETVGGLHDVLNDASHRSVAATIVLWLERLKAGDVTAPIVASVPVARAVHA